MVRFRVEDDAPISRQKYGYKARRPRTTITRIAFRDRATPVKNTRTEAENRAITARRRAARENTKKDIVAGRDELRAKAVELYEKNGTHSVKWWERAIIHSIQQHQNRRKTNKWNAYLYMTKEKRIEDGLPKLSAPELAKVAMSEWSQFSAREQEEMTSDAIKELDDHKEMDHLSVRNVPMAAFNDATSVQKRIETELKELCARTGCEALIVMTRSEHDAFYQPWTFSTDPSLEKFFKLFSGRDIGEFAKQMESFCTSGVGGAALRCEDKINELKSEVASSIAQKLADVGRPSKIARMYYVDFEQHITHKHLVVLEGWPLKRFCPPGQINSRPELQALKNALDSGTTYFRRLTKEQYAKWDKSGQPGVRGLHAPELYENNWETQDTVGGATSAPRPSGASGGAPGAPATSTNATSAPPGPDASGPEPGPDARPATSTSGTGAFLTAGSSSSSPAPDDIIPTAPISAPSSDSFVISFANGSARVAAPKKRKERSDKGVRRGPNARSAKKGRAGNAPAP